MALAETAELVVNMNLKGNFATGMKSAQTALGTTQKAATGLGAKLGTLKGTVLTGVGMGGGIAAFGMFSNAVQDAVSFVGDAIRASMEEQAAIAQLTRAIEENDDAWDGNIQAVEDVIRARENLAFADDEQRDSLRSLVATTKDVNKALDLQRTAMDLARLRGIDLATATDLVGKVYAGNIGILSRYGIQLRQGATASEALAEIQKRSRGQAQAYAETMQGSLVVAQIKMNDAMEDFGLALTPLVEDLLPLLSSFIDTAVTPAITELARIIRTDLKPAIDDAVKLIGDVTGAAVDLADTVNETVGRDVVNDFTNFARITLFMGLPLITDAMGNLHVGVNEVADAFGDLTGSGDQAARMADDLAARTNTMADAHSRAAEAIGETGDSVADTTGSVRGLIRGTTYLTKETVDLNAAIAGSHKGFKQEMEDLGSLIKRAKALGKEHDNTGERLQRLTRRKQRLEAAQARAAENGNARQVAAYQEAINKVNKGIERLQAMEDLMAAINASPPVSIDVYVNQYGRRMVGAAPGRASGGPTEANRAYLVGERGPELFVERRPGFVHDTDATRRIMSSATQPSGDISVYVRPTLTVAASSVQRETARVVRMNRARVNA